MLAVVTCLWPGDRGYRPEVVNRLSRAVKRNLSIEHRFVCMQRGFDAADFDDLVTVIDFPDEALELDELVTPEGEGFPTCYPRLWWLSRGARQYGDRILHLDADAVVVGELDGLIEYAADEPFVGFNPVSRWGTGPRVAGGIWLAEAGRFDSYWQSFLADPQGKIDDARERGYRGSDQALLSMWLGSKARFWSRGCGIYESAQIRRFPGRGRSLPPGARVVQFNGPRKPWHMNGATMPWLPEHWR